VPIINLGRRGHAAEDAVLLHNGDFQPQTGRTHRRENAGTGPSNDTQISLEHHRRLARGFRDEVGHDK
jgi:hypothetical protein